MKIHSIFLSVDGEVNFLGQGYPSVFIRLQGCNLASRPCYYCDTGSALDPDGGTEMTVLQVRDEVLKYLPKDLRRRPKVTITGGEPLLQEESLLQLLELLQPYDLLVSVETNGTLSFSRLQSYQGLCLVVDYKVGNELRLPNSHYRTLRPHDWIKFVVGSREEYLQAVAAVNQLETEARLAFSPVTACLEPSVLLNWMLRDGLLDISLNVQLHKLIGVA